MRRVSLILMTLACLFLPLAKPAAAGWFDALFSDTLVTIDGTKYTADDFKHWWEFWQEPEQPLPKSLDPYIEWLLLVREGKRMQLDEDPGFKRQTRIFLQARTLMMLKYEAVDSQVKVTEAEVKARYEEKYLPRWQVQGIEFRDVAAANAAWELLSQGAATIEEILARDAEQGGPVKTSEQVLRPSGIDPGWAAIFGKLAPGEVVDPSEHQGGPSLFRLVDRKGFDEEDFAKFSENIRKDLWKEQNDALTAEMLQHLRRKYQVEVDEERIAALDINAPEESLTEAVVIKTSQQNVSEKEFIAVIRKLMANRAPAAHAAADRDLASTLKSETVENIIAQSVTNWESLDRHYEEKEPFKWAYEFNYNHRLVLAVENLLAGPAAEVTDEEIKKHYEEKIEKYTQPGLVKLEIVDDSQGPVDQVWADVVVGKDFKKAVKEHFDMNVETRDVPANHLDPEVKKMVDTMAVGDVSPIFSAKGSRVIVHLVDRTPAAPLDLARVEGLIRKELKTTKIEKAISSYMDKIKSASRIEVREKQWKAIQKELGGV